MWNSCTSTKRVVRILFFRFGIFFSENVKTRSYLGGARWFFIKKKAGIQIRVEED
uniref:Uncharacterized protein n=1 Tax=Arundo donax TaxID=35708 RepID=A0A0A8ZUI5_ARUDO